LRQLHGAEKTASFVSFEDEVEDACHVCGQRITDTVAAVVNAVEAGSHRAALETAIQPFLKELAGDTPIWQPPHLTTLDAIAAGVAQWLAADAARQEIATGQRQALANLTTQAKAGDPAAKARTWVTTNMPSFIYFEDYGQLKTRINLPTYLSRVANPDGATRTQIALFEKSGLDPQEILQLGKPKADPEKDEVVQRRKDTRSVLLESASFALTGDWSDWWPTGKTHKLHFGADGDDLVLRVSDSHSAFQIPFEERSHGFQWFFSFYLVFLVESAKAHKNAILLLDEPGLHLHPTLQARLIEFFNSLAETNQLIYSTHLPFLVDGNRLDRVRTVYLTGDDPQKTAVSNDVRPAGDRDTLFPLQAALGYSIAQTLFMGKHTAIVEGITDYWLLKGIDGCFRGLNLTPTIDDATILVPAGGTSKLLPLASIMFASLGEGSDKKMLVLLDSDAGGNAAKERVKELFGGDDSRVLMLGDVINRPAATIEDLVPRKDYAAAVAAATHKAVVLNTTEEAVPTNVAALEKAFERLGLGSFGLDEKVQTALYLIQEWGKNPSSLPAATRPMAQALFEAINQRFE